MRKLQLGLFTAMVLGLVTGCSNSQTPARISGKVTYKGQPVKGGNVSFISDKGIYNATLSSDGTYEIIDVPTGSMKVTIETETVNPAKAMGYAEGQKAAKGGASGARAEQMKEYMAAMKKDGGGGGDQAPGGWGAPPKEELAKLYVKIPAKYAHPQTSGLTANVEPGSQVKDFELKD